MGIVSSRLDAAERQSAVAGVRYGDGLRSGGGSDRLRSEAQARRAQLCNSGHASSTQSDDVRIALRIVVDGQRSGAASSHRRREGHVDGAGAGDGHWSRGAVVGLREVAGENDSRDVDRIRSGVGDDDLLSGTRRTQRLVGKRQR